MNSAPGAYRCGYGGEIPLGWNCDLCGRVGGGGCGVRKAIGDNAYPKGPPACWEFMRLWWQEYQRAKAARDGPQQEESAMSG